MRTVTIPRRTGEYREIETDDEETVSRPVTRLEEINVTTFRQIDDDLATELMRFTDRRNLGRTVTIDGRDYTLDHISHSTRFMSRSLSVYFTVARSVVRISDHWSESNGHPRSQKLNCGRIDQTYWVIDNDPARPLVESTYLAGKYPHKLLAGIAGKSVLNQTVDHWKA